MSSLPVAAQATPATPANAFRNQLQKLDGELKNALPAHIPLERFMRVVQTACASNPDLLEADRRSLFEATMKAAQDGLLPDGRQGAFVIYNVKNRDGSWGKRVQWMVMIAGILKKIRNSGDLKTIYAHIVYENDSFLHQMGDDERIEHFPADGERGRPVKVYAIAKTKDDGIYRDVMTVEDVERVRSVSRAGTKGPWVEWWEEMAKKTVLRRLSKMLPMSSDLDDLMRRDDVLYDFEGKSDKALNAPVKNPLSDYAPALPAPEEAQLLSAPEPIEEQKVIEVETSDVTVENVEDVLKAAHERGAAAHAMGVNKNKLPTEYRTSDRKPEAEAWAAGWVFAAEQGAASGGNS